MPGVTKQLPFERGTTANTGQTVDSTTLDNLEGKEYMVEDYSPSTGLNRTGHMVKLRVVRNKAAAALLPKRLVTFSTTAGKYGNQVTGYADTTAENAYPVDEYLPAAGVAVDDLFYIVVEGPAVVLSDLAGGATNLVPVGTVLVALTAVTSGATTAGRVAPQDLTGATSPLALQVQNRLGYALTARTTSNTDADILVNIGKW